MNNDTFFFHALTVPSLWVTGEYLKELIPFMIPWGNMGYALISFSEFIQIADIIGCYGISFIVVMINSLLWYVIKAMTNKRSVTPINKSGNLLFSFFRQSAFKPWFSLMVCFLLISIPVIYGKYRLGKIDLSVHNDLN